MCRLDDVTRPLYFRGNRLSLMFRVGRDGVLLLSGIGKVVILTAATAAVGTFLNEQDGIEIKLHGFLFQIEIFQIDDAYLRIPCLAT